MIRQSQTITGIKIGDKEHRIIQYADDTTVCVSDFQSIREIVKIFDKFGTCSGLKLNYSKTKGIWLGNLKDFGMRVHTDIVFTGKPVKCLGIYIGHKTEKCEELNWSKKLEKIEKCIHQWKKCNLCLLGKINVIKTYLMSKIVYTASVLETPTYVIRRLKNIVFNYIWGKRDRVKRSTITKKLCEGGLNMIDIDCYLDSLKVAWITRFVNNQGKWLDVLQYYLHQIDFTLDYLLKINVRSIQGFPILEVLPTFYQSVFLTFNKCKTVKSLSHMSESEICQQPLWGNMHFRFGNTCIYLREWIKDGIMYIKDLINEYGIFRSEEEFFMIIDNKFDIVKQLFIIKQYVYKRLRGVNLDIAPYVKIKCASHILHENKYFDITTCKSKDFYNMLVKRCQTKGHMESIFSREFGFQGNCIWHNVYCQKINTLFIPKLAEFNYKMLQNIVPCGYVLNKWQKNVKECCEYCGQIETTKHMIFECDRIANVWDV